MNVLIILNTSKNTVLKIAEDIKRYLEEKGHSVSFLSAGKEGGIKNFTLPFSLAVAIGGDGTVLYAAREVCEKKIPILPVNQGSFGYITEIAEDEWQEALESFLNGEDVISKRQMLNISVVRKGEKVWQSSALNEATISSSVMARLVSLDIFIHDTQLGSFRADGVIISTATGSTGYSLASGGPILESEVDAMVITPICPFTLSNRPVVTAGERVSVKVKGNQRTSVELYADSQVKFSLVEEDIVIIEKSKNPCLFIKSKKRNFTDIIRDKLNWQGSFNA